MTNTEPHPLGRLEEFDERSRAYPIRTLLAGISIPRSYTWSCGVQLDQGNVGACVGFSWAAELAARPVVVPAISNDTGLSLYHSAQLIDEWAGEAYEGTSVLAGAKVVQMAGLVDEYRWAFSFDDLILAIGYKGPAVLGINWFEGMDWPDAGTGIVHATGALRGGHAILANGVSIRNGLVRLHNSWGPWWGYKGDCFISFDDLRKLLAERGEACIPVRRSQ